MSDDPLIRCLAPLILQNNDHRHSPDATETTSRPTSKTTKKFLDIGKKSNDSRRRLMDTLQRSIFEIVPRKSDGESGERVAEELNHGHDHGKTVRRAMSQGFNIDPYTKALPRTPSKSERLLLANKSEPRKSRFARSLLDVSEITPSRSNAEWTDSQDTARSIRKTSFGRGLRNSILGWVGRARREDREVDIATPSKPRLESSSKRQMRSMGVSFDGLRGSEGKHGRADRKRNASLIELNIGNP